MILPIADFKVLRVPVTHFAEPSTSTKDSSCRWIVSTCKNVDSPCWLMKQFLKLHNWIVKFNSTLEIIVLVHGDVASGQYVHTKSLCSPCILSEVWVLAGSCRSLYTQHSSQCADIFTCVMRTGQLPHLQVLLNAVVSWDTVVNCYIVQVKHYCLIRVKLAVLYKHLMTKTTLAYISAKTTLNTVVYLKNIT